MIPRPGLHAAAWLATHLPLTPLIACKNRLVRQLEGMGQKVILEPVGPGGCRSATNSAPTSLLRSLYLASTLICLKRGEPVKGMKYALSRKAVLKVVSECRPLDHVLYFLALRGYGQTFRQAAQVVCQMRSLRGSSPAFASGSLGRRHGEAWR